MTLKIEKSLRGEKNYIKKKRMTFYVKDILITGYVISISMLSCVGGHQTSASLFL